MKKRKKRSNSKLRNVALCGRIRGEGETTVGDKIPIYGCWCVSFGITPGTRGARVRADLSRAPWALYLWVPVGGLTSACNGSSLLPGILTRHCNGGFPFGLDPKEKHCETPSIDLIFYSFIIIKLIIESIIYLFQIYW